MVTHGSVAKSVRESKEKYPEKYCPNPRCLGNTGGGPCPKHGGPSWKELDSRRQLLLSLGAPREISN